MQLHPKTLQPSKGFPGISVTSLCVVCVCEHHQARVKCALLLFDHYSTACARSVQTCQQNNCSPVLQEQLGGSLGAESLLGPVCSHGEVLHLHTVTHQTEVGLCVWIYIDQGFHAL